MPEKKLESPKTIWHKNYCHFFLQRGHSNSLEEVSKMGSREGNRSEGKFAAVSERERQRDTQVTPSGPGISLCLQDGEAASAAQTSHPRPGPQEVLPALGFGASYLRGFTSREMESQCTLPKHDAGAGIEPPSAFLFSFHRGLRPES